MQSLTQAKRSDSSLEVAYGPSDNDVDLCGTLSTFLKTFHGLRDLFITLLAPAPTLDLRRSMAHRKLTLTRFVCRDKTVKLDENFPHLEEEMGLLDSSLLPEDGAELDRSEAHHPFAALNLECIGLGCTPQLLV